jgi:SAM-dependent methyltransferase
VTRELSSDDLRWFCASIIPAPSALQVRMINEAAFGLSRVRPMLDAFPPAAPRLLEVGAGSLILSTYLACRGFDVTALEPMSEEFEFFEDLARPMRDAAARAGASLRLVQQSVDQFDAVDMFDVVFSINALEHMANPLGAMDIMYRAVRPGGRLLVHCPNYDVPFDSHFGIVLMTLNKRVNERVYGRRFDTMRGVWNGLTFIRQSVVTRYCAAQGYRVSFNGGMLRDAVLRLRDDDVFSARMPRLLRAAGRFFTHPRIVAALGRVPLRFQTPMEFVLSK